MLGTLKSSVTHSLLRRPAEYLVLNKRSKISTDFRLYKNFNANLFGTSYDLKKKKTKCLYTGKGKMTRLKDQSHNHSTLNQ